MAVLEALVINPSKKKKKKRRRTKAPKVLTVKRGRKNVGILLIKNPVQNQKSLMLISAGTAFGLAGGKVIEGLVVPKIQPLNSLLQKGIPVGDIAVMGIGLMGLRKGSRNKEFFLGLVAGAGARAFLNLIDHFVFKNKGIVSLRAEEEENEPLPEPENEEVIPADIEEMPQEEIEPQEEEIEPQEEEKEDVDVLSYGDDLPIDEISKPVGVDAI